jgi:hypothetical protein
MGVTSVAGFRFRAATPGWLFAVLKWVSFDRSGRRAGSKRAPAGYLAKFVFVSTLDAGNQF